jgi:hypothetical protein
MDMTAVTTGHGGAGDGIQQEVVRNLPHISVIGRERRSVFYFFDNKVETPCHGDDWEAAILCWLFYAVALGLAFHWFISQRTSTVQAIGSLGTLRACPGTDKSLS